MDGLILALTFAAFMFWNAFRLSPEARYMRWFFAAMGLNFVALAWIDRDGGHAPLWIKLSLIALTAPFAVASYMRDELGQRGRARFALETTLRRWFVSWPRGK